MSDEIGWVVRSTAGHDKDDIFCVVGVQENFLLLADGKTRKVGKPKRKKKIHVDIICRTAESDTIIQTLRRKEPVTDPAMRRWLAAFKGGNHAWQEKI